MNSSYLRDAHPTYKSLFKAVHKLKKLRHKVECCSYESPYFDTLQNLDRSIESIEQAIKKIEEFIIIAHCPERKPFGKFVL